MVYFNRKIALQFDSAHLIVDQNIYIAKIVNIYIVYDLDYWPKDCLRSFILKSNLLKIVIKKNLCMGVME